MVNDIKKNFRYVDVPEIRETYVDCLGLSTFVDGSLRLELCVSRMDEPKPPSKPTGRKYPVCRLVLTPDAAANLANMLNQMMSALTTQGAANIGPNPFPDTSKH